MSTTEHLVDHLRSVYHDGAWSDVSVRAAFEVLTHEQAAARPIPGRHTAWEILLHLDAWHRAMTRRLSGETVRLSEDEDWPHPPAATRENWDAALKHLDDGFDEFLSAVSRFQDEDLSTTLKGGRHDAYESIVGIGEHDLYHAGQVVFLNC